jgi:hypothetical protein
VWFQNAARPRKISIPSYCCAKRLTSFGTKLARNVKKGKEEKRDGERGKGMMKYLQRSSRSSWGGSVDLPGPPPPFPPLFNPAIAPHSTPPRPPGLPRLRPSDSVTSKDAQDVEREKKEKKKKSQFVFIFKPWGSRHFFLLPRRCSQNTAAVQKQKSQPHDATTTLTQQGKKKSGRFCEYIHSSSLFFFSLPSGNYHPASATLTGERGGGGGSWAGRGFSADVPNLRLYE